MIGSVLLCRICDKIICMKDKKLIIASGILLILSMIIHFAFFGQPREVVFDEVYFGRFISSYEKGEYFFDIHPPLGKLLIFGFVHFAHVHVDDDFSMIGNAYVSYDYLFLRFLPCLVGAFIPIILFFVALSMDYSFRSATVLCMLTIFENSLVVQTHFLFLDGFLLFFIFLAVLMYVLYLKKRKIYTLIFFGIFCGMAISVKWTGATFFFMIILYDFCTQINYTKQYVWERIFCFVVIPCMIYFAIFMVHFSILSYPKQDYTYISRDFYFESDLDRIDTFNEAVINTFCQFWELNHEMYVSNKNLIQSHPYSSQWFEWPLMIKPIFYWTDDHGRSIYYFGNCVVWFFGLTAVILAFINQWKIKFQKNSFLNFLLLGYFVNWIPFIFIDRVMFLYHYMTSFIFSVMILVYLLDKKHFFKKIDIIVVILTVFMFLALYPITYGI